MFCTNCGKKLSDESLICEYCGEKLDIEGIDDDKIISANYIKRDKPIKTGYFFLMQLILLVPVINIVLLLILAFKKNVNFNLKAYSRSILIWILIFLFLLISIFIYMLIIRYPINVSYWFLDFKEFINSINISL